MQTPSRIHAPRIVPMQAFTLIELLVVISIIAVLAGILLPVGQSVINNSRKVSAKSTLMTIVSAVKSYQSDYGTYPVVPPAPPADTTFNPTADAAGDGTDKHNDRLFTVLRALNVPATGPDPAKPYTLLNPRRVVYFEYPDAKNQAAPRNGFVNTTAAAGAGPKDGTNSVTLVNGDLVDPWGDLYGIRIDTGYSDRVFDPYLNANKDGDDAGADTADVLHTSVIAWSWGKDGVAWKGTSSPSFEASGNVASWR